MKGITFPTTPGEFVNYQEQLMGKVLDDNQKEILIPYVEILNQIYADALEGDSAFLCDALKIADDLIAMYPSEGGLVYFMKSYKLWCACAYQQGVQDAEKEVERV